MKINSLPSLLIILLLSSLGSLSYADPAYVGTSTAAVQTQMSLRDLWVEHVFWIRNYVIANQQDQESARTVAADQVVNNATQIANSLAPLYGQDAADKLLGLLAGHWGAVKDYSDATIADNKAKEKQALTDLNKNAGDIADFLSAANPNLPRSALFSLLSVHGAQHVSQIEQIAAGQYAQEAETWHAMRQHVLVIADTLTSALVKQFPAKF